MGNGGTPSASGEAVSARLAAQGSLPGFTIAPGEERRHASGAEIRLTHSYRTIGPPLNAITPRRARTKPLGWRRNSGGCDYSPSLHPYETGNPGHLLGRMGRAGASQSSWPTSRGIAEATGLATLLLQSQIVRFGAFYLDTHTRTCKQKLRRA